MTEPTQAPPTDELVGEQSPNADAPASELTNTASTTATDASNVGSMTGASGLTGSSPTSPSDTPPTEPQQTPAQAADAAFVNDPTTQQASLAGTSGKPPGQNKTGMASEATTEKVTPQAATNKGNNAGVETAPGVNVVVAGAPHPLMFVAHTRTSELRDMLNNFEQSVFVKRALTDLKNVEDWITQHFAEAKRSNAKV